MIQTTRDATLTKKKVAPSLRVLCGKVGNENLDDRKGFGSVTRWGRAILQIEVPPMEKAQEWASPNGFRVSHFRAEGRASHTAIPRTKTLLTAQFFEYSNFPLSFF